MNETEDLVAFLADMSYGDLPPEVIATAKLCLLDTLGVGLFASQMEWTKIVVEAVAGAGGAVAESAAWGLSPRTAAHYAALINGTAAHGIEMDDRKPALTLHTGSMTIPAALAVGEKTQADGREVLTAIVAGYEVPFRVARAMPLWTDRGLHPAGHKGIWGSVAAASKVLDLDKDQMLNAFGLAGSMASGIWEFSQDPKGTMVKRFHGGWASHNGVIAAILGQKGLTGPRTVLEGKFGYCHAFAGSVEPRPEELTKDLGKSFQILEREVKPYSAWGQSHSCIEAVTQLKAQHQIDPQQIDKIIITGPSEFFEKHEMKEPQSIMAAQYSLPFITAMAFFQDLRDPSVWTDEILRDRATLDMCRRVEMYIDDERERVFQETRGFSGSGVTVTFKLRDGKERCIVVNDAKGTLGNPMTSEEIHDKFRLLASNILSHDQVEEIARTVDALEEIDNVCRLGDLLLA